MTLAGSRGTGRAKSCVVCRQFKLACDARKTAPDPCTRCVSKNLTCRFDPNFKRISTRKIAQEVADELHTLRAAQYSDSTSRTSGGSHPQIVIGGQSPVGFQDSLRAPHSSSSSSFGQPPSESSHTHCIELAEDELVLDQNIHGVSVSSSRILKLFYHFDRYYFPHARFITKITSINRLATKCPLLFCTILVIASERYEGGSDGLYEQLCNIHAILMADVVQKSIQQLEVVHALLLLCLWPIPKLRNAYDPSWNYIALAISAASSLDCQAPLGKNAPTSHYRGLSDTRAADMDPSNQALTWIACYEIGIRLGTYLGLPPPLCMPQQAKRIRKSQQLAADFLTPADRAMTRILDVLCCANSQSDAIEDNASHFTMATTYEMQLDAVAMQYKENWSDGLEAQLLASKIYILGIALTQDLPADEDMLSQAVPYRQLILEKGMKASVGLISTMVNLSNQNIPGHRYASGILTFYPKSFFASLVAAAAFLFRFIVNYQGATQTQQTQAIGYIAEAHKILQSFPDHRDAMRACVNIETFVNAIRKNSGMVNTELLVKNRLGASVLQDAMFRAAQHRNRNPVDGSSPPVTQWAALDATNGHQLPLAPEQKVASSQGSPWQDSHLSTEDPQSQDMAAWVPVWDNYFNAFGVLTEPWVQHDDEFAMAGLQAQAMFPSMQPTYEYAQPTGPGMGS